MKPFQAMTPAKKEASTRVKMDCVGRESIITRCAHSKSSLSGFAIRLRQPFEKGADRNQRLLNGRG
jgi:hypothetical protein